MNIGKLRDQYKSALLDDVLPFWLNHGTDHDHGGIFTSLNRDGALLDTDKGVWVQGRFAWLLSAVSQYADTNESWISIAKSGLDFIDQHCVDKADGLLWFHVTADGRPIRKRRYRFSEAFACLGNAAYYQCSENPHHANRAKDLFNTFVDHQQVDSAYSPFPEKYTDTRPFKSIGNPMIAINMAQVCRSAGIPATNWDRIIDDNIHEIESHFVQPAHECVMETVAKNGTVIDDHFEGRTLNPGHAIEAAWFILEEAKRRGNDSHLVKLGTTMLDWMWDRGWDREFGGLLYFVGVDGKPVQEYWHDMKFWWPHNEAEIATLLAWQLTGESRYAHMHEQVHDWAWSHFPDPDYGEWFGYLRRDGSISNQLKGNLWKGPFHIPRMMLTCWKICDEILNQ